MYNKYRKSAFVGSYYLHSHILYSATFFSPENRTVYEIMSKNMVEPKKAKTVWRLRGLLDK